jgi:hypothetical protein
MLVLDDTTQWIASLPLVARLPIALILACVALVCFALDDLWRAALLAWRRVPRAVRRPYRVAAGPVPEPLTVQRRPDLV